ncbi:DUF6894 family protein [Rhizobium grahamii]
MSDLATAREEAIKAAREMLAEKVLAGERIDGQVFEIVAGTGRLVETILSNLS